MMIPEDIANLHDLASWFAEIAEREHQTADAFRIGGRFERARQHEKRALLWTQAAAACAKAGEPA